MKLLDICTRCIKHPDTCETDISDIKYVCDSNHVPIVIVDCKNFKPKDGNICSICQLFEIPCHVRTKDVLLSGGHIYECKKMQESTEMQDSIGAWKTAVKDTFKKKKIVKKAMELLANTTISDKNGHADNQ